jgi:cyclopropane-fatty-acyl-phospholipid synthase
MVPLLERRLTGVARLLNCRLIRIPCQRVRTFAAGCDSASSGYSRPMQLLDKMLRPLLKRGELTIIGPDGSTTATASPIPSCGRSPCASGQRVALQIVRDPGARHGRDLDGRPAAARRGRDHRPDPADPPQQPLGGALGPQQVQEVHRPPAHLVNTYNRKTNSKKNVAHHYDIGNDIYRTFLDPDMQYSCGYFTDPANSIEQAQLDKKAHIASKLYLSPGQKVVDIGCGWGGLALYLNRVADVDVLGITLSTEQLAVARERAARAGVADRVKFELMDYRDLEGPFDRVGLDRHVRAPRHRVLPDFLPQDSRDPSSPTASRWCTPWAGWASRARPMRSCRSTFSPAATCRRCRKWSAPASASGW